VQDRVVGIECTELRSVFSRDCRYKTIDNRHLVLPSPHVSIRVSAARWIRKSMGPLQLDFTCCGSAPGPALPLRSDHGRDPASDGDQQLLPTPPGSEGKTVEASPKTMAAAPAHCTGIRKPRVLSDASAPTKMIAMDKAASIIQ
jgi:hypothetical protein